MIIPLERQVVIVLRCGVLERGFGGLGLVALAVTLLCGQVNLAAVERGSGALDAGVVGPGVVLHAAADDNAVALGEVPLAGVIGAAPDDNRNPVGRTVAVLVLVVAVNGDAETDSFLAVGHCGDLWIVAQATVENSVIQTHLDFSSNSGGKRIG